MRPTWSWGSAVGGGRVGGQPAEHRLHAGDQLAGLERFCDIVIRAKTQPDQDVALIGLCRHHNDAGALDDRIILDEPAEFDAVDARQHKIKQNQIGRFLPD